MDQRGIAEADMQRGLAGDALKRPVDHRDAKAAGLVGARLHVGLVDLHDVGAGVEEVLDLLVDRRGIAHRQGDLVLVVVVLRLLRHGEGAGHRDLDRTAGLAAQELDVAHLDRPRPPDRPDHPRHGARLADAIELRAGVVDVDAVERGREAVRVAFPPHLAVGDDV